MITRFRYHQVYIGGDPTDPNLGYVDIEGPDGTTPVIVQADFVGGGADKRFLLHVVTSETLKSDKKPWQPPNLEGKDSSDV